MRRGARCPPDCACGRHKGSFCPPGCTCARHRMRKCGPACTCGKHGDSPGYQARHRRVWEARGKAVDQLCYECGSQAAQWAQIHGTDGLDPHDHYQPMCRRCHVRYDDVIDRARKANTGLKRTEAQKAAQSEQMRQRNARLTPEQRSENTRKGWKTRQSKKDGG